MTISLRYDIPLYVEVDLDAKMLTRVVVDDTFPQSLHDFMQVFSFPEGQGYGFEDEIDRSDPRVSEAIEIATDADWPGWDFGW